MSFVTTAVLVVAYAEDGITDMILSHDFRAGRGARQSFGRMGDQDEWAGGTKFPELDVYVAGFNYVPGPEVEEWFKGLPWASDDAAYLVWDCNGETRGSVSIGWVNW